MFFSYKEVKILMLSRYLPVEEGLIALRMQPLDIIEVEVVPVTMSWINLFNTKKFLYVSNNIFILVGTRKEGTKLRCRNDLQLPANVVKRASGLCHSLISLYLPA